MSEMVERVARAIAWEDLTPGGRKVCRYPDDFSEGEIALYRLKAIAAIEAMRVPSESMKIAGGEAQQQSIGSWGEPGVVYRAMISAALSEDTGQEGCRSTRGRMLINDRSR